MNNQTFRSRIRESIQNETLQTALDNNTERRLRGKALAFESIPDWRERRQRAHRIRADVIDHLDKYLDQFISNAQANGIIVHRAKDANEAIEIVLEISKSITNHQLPNTLVAKSKSMVSEEIELNHTLEKHGINVVETDLGEYIVQLRKEKPSHLITPAAHLKKEQVAQLFHEKLGIPYTEDIPTLTATARKVLREVFLTADIGISGVNFGVAETGGICIVTNEGNGRMVTSIPKTHIALMGIERIAPNLNDLALLLSLLPRSATGQKLTVYTQLIHKPMPGQTRHIILLDNGRTRVRNSPLKESLYCIRCGACLNVCPIFRNVGGHTYGTVYGGPIGSVITPHLRGLQDWKHLSYASSLCGACTETCPVKIDLHHHLLQNRRNASAPATGKPSWWHKLAFKVFAPIANQPALWSLTTKLGRFGQKFHGLIKGSRLDPAQAWTKTRELPPVAKQSFREWWKERER